MLSEKQGSPSSPLLLVLFDMDHVFYQHQIVNRMFFPQLVGAYMADSAHSSGDFLLHPFQNPVFQLHVW